MWRAFLEGLLLFALPFVLFAGWIALTRDKTDARGAMRAGVGWLTVIGLAVVIATIVWRAATVEPHRGAYIPAEMKDGVLVPGQVR